MSSFTSTDKAIVLQCRCLNHLFTKIRDKNTTRKDFVTYSRRLMRVICEEGIACLNPGMDAQGKKNICCVAEESRSTYVIYFNTCLCEHTMYCC